MGKETWWNLQHRLKKQTESSETTPEPYNPDQTTMFYPEGEGTEIELWKPLTQAEYEKIYPRSIIDIWNEDPPDYE
jgi:hypothetical protein